MKKTLISAAFGVIAIAGVLWVVQSITQRDPPEVVREGFKRTFPHVHQVNWNQKDNVFTAHWGGISGDDSIAVFTKTGHMVTVKDQRK